ncbi:MAG: 23S rRNA (uracil(1939)-C(5))-methyltransferase RlmD [Lachnospiraceae bacterium]|nr:23S rRNA (uracil(1939)-C(5))-methyltransferase RlmD [Lachnospiraceae bacterium]
MSKNSGRKYTEGSRSTSKKSRQMPAESRCYPDRRNRSNVSSAWENGSEKSDRQPSCPVMKKCGGCQYQDVSYKRQLAIKQEQVSKLLKPFCRVYPITGMEDPYHYRNKVHAVFDRLKDGTIISGVYEEKTHRVVPVNDCLIEDEKADAIIRDIRGMLRSFKIKTFDEDTGYGLLRHVLVRRGFATGQIMVVLVLGSPILPSKNNFVQALRKLHPEISTIVINVNNKRTSMVLGEKETVIYGKGYIEDILCGQTFRISSKSFYQVNPAQTGKLYAKAIELAGLTGKERVIDAYCGIGTIGICAASRAQEVIGVELNRDAVRDAVRNAKRNDKENISFYNADAGEFMMQMAAQGERVDVVFMDPPRSGSSEAFLRAAVRVRPARIIYISCNPDTQARDLKYLKMNGYRAQGAYPYDCFPFTGHIETIVQLSREEVR